MARLFAICVAVSMLILAADLGSIAQEKEKKQEAKNKSGTVIGILVAKDKNSIEVKAAGEEKGRRYVPHWIGGMPAQGGGLDKKMLKIFAELQVGSRVEVKWEFEERLRAVEVKVLKAAEKKD